MKKFYNENKKPILIGTSILFILILVGIGYIIFHYKHQPFRYSPNIADNIYNFLNEWASAFAPGITLILAVAAFWTIWQNYKFKRKDWKERLLNEIIEWSTSIAEVDATRQGRNSVATSDVENTLIKFRIINAKSGYIKASVKNYETFPHESLEQVVNGLSAVVINSELFIKNNSNKDILLSKWNELKDKTLELMQKIGELKQTL